jgi:hypothetical protein
VLKERKAAPEAVSALAQAGPAHAAMLFIVAPPEAASDVLELKMRPLNFLCRQLTSLATQSQPFQQGVKPN